MSDGDVPVRITAREIYDTVVETRDEVRALRDSDTGILKIISDHESRIRINERWRYALPIALLVSFSSIMVALT